MQFQVSLYEYADVNLPSYQALCFYFHIEKIRITFFCVLLYLNITNADPGAGISPVLPLSPPSPSISILLRPLSPSICLLDFTNLFLSNQHISILPISIYLTQKSYFWPIYISMLLPLTQWMQIFYFQQMGYTDGQIWVSFQEYADVNLPSNLSIQIYLLIAKIKIAFFWVHLYLNIKKTLQSCSLSFSLYLYPPSAFLFLPLPLSSSFYLSLPPSTSLFLLLPISSSL